MDDSSVNDLSLVASRVTSAVPSQLHPSTSSFDDIPQGKPEITTHDALWAQMESLQDDIERARAVHKSRGFVDPVHAEALNKLKKTQIDFAMAMSREESGLGLDHYRDVWRESNPEKLRTRLFDDPYFDSLDEQVKKTAANLEQVASMMDNRDGRDGRDGQP